MKKFLFNVLQGFPTSEKVLKASIYKCKNELIEELSKFYGVKFMWLCSDRVIELVLDAYFVRCGALSSMIVLLLRFLQVPPQLQVYC